MSDGLLDGRKVPWNFIVVADTPESALEPPIDWRRPLARRHTLNPAEGNVVPPEGIQASSYNGVIHQYPTILEALGLVALVGVTARDLSHQIASNLIRRWANR